MFISITFLSKFSPTNMAWIRSLICMDPPMVIQSISAEKSFGAQLQNNYHMVLIILINVMRWMKQIKRVFVIYSVYIIFFAPKIFETLSYLKLHWSNSNYSDITWTRKGSWNLHDFKKCTLIELRNFTTFLYL